MTATERLEDGSDNCAVGRRPEGYSPSAHGASLGDYLAMAAELEASSVPAFRRSRASCARTGRRASS